VRPGILAQSTMWREGQQDVLLVDLAPHCDRSAAYSCTSHLRIEALISPKVCELHVV
jgi:hypothetical protein